MTAFDATLNVAGLTVSAPNEEALRDDSQPAQLMVGLTLGNVMPTQKGPAVVPFGRLQFPLDREDALKVADSIREEAEKLPERKHSDIMVASNLNEVEEAAKRMKQVTDGSN